MASGLEASINGQAFAVLCGAGISARAGMPTAAALHELVLRYVDSARLQILVDLFRPTRPHAPRLRFEGILDVLQRTVDPTLSVLDPYREGVRTTQHAGPTAEHEALSKIARCMAPVVTTNIDGLIEAAHTDAQSPLRVRFREDEFGRYDAHDARGLWKIHGTLDEFSAGDATALAQDDPGGPVVTLRSISRTRESGNRQTFLHRLMAQHFTVVVGYSGSDDFDITRWLREVDVARGLIWVQYVAGREGLVPLPEVRADRDGEYDAGLRKLVDNWERRSDQPLLVLRSRDPAGLLCELAGISRTTTTYARQPLSRPKGTNTTWENRIVTGCLLAQVCHYQSAIAELQGAVSVTHTAREAALANLELARAYLSLGGTDVNFRAALRAAEQAITNASQLATEGKPIEGNAQLVKLAAERRMKLARAPRADLEALEKSLRAEALQAPAAIGQQLEAIAFEASVERSQLERWTLNGAPIRANVALMSSGLLPPKGIMSHDEALNAWKAASSVPALRSAVRLLEDAVEFREDVGDIVGLCGSLNVLGFMAQRWAWLFPHRPFPATEAMAPLLYARQKEEASLALARRHGLAFHVNQALVGLSILYLRMGNVEQAASFVEELSGYSAHDERTGLEARFCAAMSRLAEGKDVAAATGAAAPLFRAVALDGAGTGDARMVPASEAARWNADVCEAWSRGTALALPIALQHRNPSLPAHEGPSLQRLACLVPATPTEAARLVLDCLGP